MHDQKVSLFICYEIENYREIGILKGQPPQTTSQLDAQMHGSIQAANQRFEVTHFYMCQL